MTIVYTYLQSSYSKQFKIQPPMGRLNVLFSVGWHAYTPVMQTLNYQFQKKQGSMLNHGLAGTASSWGQGWLLLLAPLTTSTVCV